MAKQTSFWPPWWEIPKQSTTDPAFNHMLGWITGKALEGGVTLNAQLREAPDGGATGFPTSGTQEIVFRGINRVTHQATEVVVQAYSTVRLPEVTLCSLEMEFGFGDPTIMKHYTPPAAPPPAPPVPPDVSTLSPIGKPVSGVPGRFHRAIGVPLPANGLWVDAAGKNYKWVEYVSPFGATGWWELVP